MRSILKVFSSDEYCHTGCEFALVNLTPALASRRSRGLPCSKDCMHRDCISTDSLFRLTSVTTSPLHSCRCRAAGKSQGCAHGSSCSRRHGNRTDGCRAGRRRRTIWRGPINAIRHCTSRRSPISDRPARKRPHLWITRRNLQGVIKAIRPRRTSRA